MRESEKIDKYLDPARELKKPWNMKVTVIPIVLGALGMIPQRCRKEIGENDNQKENRSYADHSIIKIGRNTEESPGNLRGALRLR